MTSCSVGDEMAMGHPLKAPCQENNPLPVTKKGSFFVFWGSHRFFLHTVCSSVISTVPWLTNTASFQSPIWFKAFYNSIPTENHTGSKADGIGKPFLPLQQSKKSSVPCRCPRKRGSHRYCSSVFTGQTQCGSRHGRNSYAIILASASFLMKDAADFQSHL